MANSTSRGRKRASLGSKKEVSPGVWQVRVSVGYRPDGGQRRVTEYVHGDERDADTAILRLAASMRKNVNLGRGTDLDTYFWVQFAPGRRASTTRANAETCESVYRCHIGPGTFAHESRNVDLHDLEVRPIDGCGDDATPADHDAVTVDLNHVVGA